MSSTGSSKYKVVSCVEILSPEEDLEVFPSSNPT